MSNSQSPIDRRTVERLAFARLPRMNGMRRDLILQIVGSEEAFFAMPQHELQQLMASQEEMLSDSARRQALSLAERELLFNREHNIRVTFPGERDFPNRLESCEDAPLYMLSLGETNLNGSLVVSVVGTRHATSYGKETVNIIIKSLAEMCSEPPVIVSGLAYGIDIAAHRAALEYGLPTVAVMGHGLNTIYPASHRQTATKMVHQGGMLMTEYFTSDATHPGNFLARNRIVAGLCDVLIVVESDSRGGSLSTARLAMEYGREVLAVPGRMSDRFSRGCNTLIAKNGASIMLGPEDVFKVLGREIPQQPEAQAQPALFSETADPETAAIVRYMRDSGEPVHPRAIAAGTGRQLGAVQSLLLRLELEGVVVSVPGGAYDLI